MYTEARRKLHKIGKVCIWILVGYVFGTFVLYGFGTGQD
jgi:hypothetical protein